MTSLRLFYYRLIVSLTFHSLAVISRTAGLNIQHFFIVLTVRLIVLYGILLCTALKDKFCITEVGSVYCAVRTQSLYKT